MDTNQNIIKVGVIGDSWVSYKHLDSSIIGSLKSLGVNADIISFGHPGAKSKNIFLDMISENNLYSSNSLLRDKDIRYIVVVAGVNDAVCHMGKDFYTHHMINIVSVINSHEKLPIIVEVPEFGIEDIKEGFLSTIKHFISKVLFDIGKTDIVSDYRKSLKTKLGEQKLNYIILPFDPVVKDYSTNKYLYENPSHLNKEGYKQLGSYIGQSIATKCLNS